jgi:hypothetical protein
MTFPLPKPSPLHPVTVLLLCSLTGYHFDENNEIAANRQPIGCIGLAAHWDNQRILFTISIANPERADHHVEEGDPAPIFQGTSFLATTAPKPCLLQFANKRGDI